MIRLSDEAAIIETRGFGLTAYMTQNGKPGRKDNVRLFLWRGCILYLGPVDDVAVHAHHAIQAAVSPLVPIEVGIGSETIRTRSIMIDSNRPHRLDSLGQHAAIFLIDPESREAACLRQGVLRNRGHHVIDPQLVDPIVEALSVLDRDGAGCAEARHCFDQLLETWGRDLQAPSVRDERIDNALEFIQQLPQKKISLPELAAVAFLSESRFIHLFTEQVGIPPRRYLLWTRLMDAVRAALREDNLTSAAHNAGFADSAHLSRTFKRMFGQAPSFLVSGAKNSQFVQAFLCPN